MCFERYKGYSMCAHADPQSTPLEPQPCEELIATGACARGKTPVLVPAGAAMCPGCGALQEQLYDAVGSLLDERVAESDTWALWYRIGWSSTDAAILREINHVRCVVVVEMNAWKDPRHARQLRFAAWIDIFEEFKDWLWERLGKRNAEGRLYFPLGEEKDARIEKTKVLQHVVRWTMANMADGKFDGLDTAVFREGLDRAFSNLIYQWDTHFTDEPGFDVAKGEFTRYWTGWLTMRDKARKQGQGGSLTS